MRSRIPKAQAGQERRRGLKRFEELYVDRPISNGNETKEIYIPPGPRLGDLVIEAQPICARDSATGC